VRSGTRRAGLGAAALALVLALGACGSGDNGTTASQSSKPVAIAKIEPSLETEAAGFVNRPGTELDRVLKRFLGPALKVKVEPDSAICRPGSDTPSIENPNQYPFACILRANANGQGLEVEITLGFVGTELDGSCWRAANERVLVTSTEPTLLGRQAKLPVNQVKGCVET
jgi:hypothetical protein